MSTCCQDSDLRPRRCSPARKAEAYTPAMAQIRFVRWPGRILAGCMAFAIAASAFAAGSLLDSLTSKDASSGLRAALSQGIDTAVTQLGAPDGFLKDPKVTIPL